MPGCLAMGTPFDFADEINLVSSSTGGEAAPEPALKVYAESGGVVTAVEGTRSEELTAMAFKMEVEPIVGKDRPDADLRFELPERVVEIRHFYSHPGPVSYTHLTLPTISSV